ncbi:hypothetical protein THRCLA_11531 [Thraustotheca clavata]|uniref:Sugar phosphate transporter domain-containing protein n=1 Tax=Thraustotheca clavata TaxID=74557 RepID=A0A1V9Y7G7_9STRA|nr:hypothetical protein THRCLA_11531 [Thraustotheca clavata]
MHRNDERKAIYGLIAAWLMSSMLCSVMSKQILDDMSCPFTLSAAQMTVAFICHSIYKRWYKVVEMEVFLAEANEYLVLFAALAFAIGNACFNGGFGWMHVSISETLRALETLLAVGFASLSLPREERLSKTRMLALIPIVLGVILSARNNSAFHLFGMSMVMVANIAFPLQSLFVKMLQRTITLDKVFDMTLYYGMIFQWVGAGVSHASGGTQNLHLNAKKILFGIINGLFFYISLKCSFSVLHATNTTTHAIINAARRVMTILFSVYYFNVALAMWNGIGMLVACAGAIWYAYAHEKELDQRQLEMHDKFAA